MGFKQTIEKIDINDERRQDEFNKIFNEIKDKELPTRRKNHIIWGSAKDRRFYISDRKYYIVEGTTEQGRTGRTVKYDDYIAVELVELSSKEKYYLDVSVLLKEGIGYKNWKVDKDDDYCTFESDGIINQYIKNKVKDVKPYITNKELVDVFINYVGKRHIYFDNTDYYIPNGSLRVGRKILNAHFVKDLSVY